MSVQPGQVVRARFTVSEAPDSLPTAKIYKVDAAGDETEVTLLVSHLVYPIVVGELAYAVAYTIEAGALHSDTYTPIVTAVAGGVPEVRWLASEWVDLKPHGLTAGEVEQLAAIEGSVSSIGSGISIKFQPLTEDGDKITIVQGDDYTTEFDRDMDWTFPVSQFFDFTGFIPYFVVKDLTTNSTVLFIDGAVTTPDTDLDVVNENTETQAINLEIGRDATKNKEPGLYSYQLLIADNAGSSDGDNTYITLREGVFILKPSYFKGLVP